MPLFIASVRLIIVTFALCAGAYTALILGVAKTFAPDSAEGSLVTVEGKVVGSRLIAQGFTRPRYFWPRPSAVDYDAIHAGGSNKSPTSSALAERARGIVARFDANESRPLPAELAAASGSGLDPDLSERAALYQAARVARARKIPRERVERLIDERAFAPGGAFTPGRLVNVLELNLALDAAGRENAAPPANH